MLIDEYGTNAIFFFAYTFHMISAICMVVGTKYLKKDSNANNANNNSGNSSGLVIDSRDYGLSTTDDIKTNTSSSDIGSIKDITDRVTGGVVAVSKLIRQTTNSFQQLLRHEALKYILYNIFIYGTVMTIIDSIMTTALMTDYNTSASFGGMYTGMGVVSCIPAFYISSQFIEYFGHYYVFLFAQVTCIFRLLINSMLDIHWEHSPNVLLCTQLLHGICFALYWSTAVDIMYKLAPPDMKNTSLVCVCVCVCMGDCV